MENNKKDFKYFAITKAIIEFIDLVLILFLMDRFKAFTIPGIILFLLLPIIPNFKYKFETVKEYWNVNKKAISYYLVILVIAFFIVLSTNQENTIAAFLIVGLLINLLYIPIYLGLSFACDYIIFLIRKK